MRLICVYRKYISLNKYKPRLNKEFIYSDVKSMSLKELDSILWMNIGYYTNYLNNYTINLNDENNENEINEN